jgi:putative addiction module antidote
MGRKEKAMTTKKEMIDLQIAIGKETMDKHAGVLQGLADNPVDHSKERNPKKKAGATKAKIQKIGNSLGVILPKDVLSRQRISEGDYLTLSESPSGLILSVYDEELQEELEIGDAFMRKYRDTFKALAK